MVTPNQSAVLSVEDWGKEERRGLAPCLQCGEPVRSTRENHRGKMQ